MTKEKPSCVTIRAWLKENLGKDCLGVLTGTDSRALNAAMHIIELFAVHSEPAVLRAFAIVVGEMQPTARHLAYHAIAHALDWSDRERIWQRANLGDLPASRCAYEPKPAAAHAASADVARVGNY